MWTLLIYACTYVLIQDDYSRPVLDATVGVPIAVALHAGGRLVRTRMRGRPLDLRATAFEVATWFMVAAAVALALERWVRPLEAQSLAIPGLAHAARWLIEACGFDTFVGNGSLHVDGVDDVVAIGTTLDKLAPRPLLFTGLLWMLLPRQEWRMVSWAVVGLTALALGALRWIASCLWIANVDELYTERSTSWLATVFGSSSSMLVAVVLLAHLASEWAPGASAALAAPWSETRRSLRWAIAVVALSSCWLVAGLDLPGPRKSGVVVFDDQHCGSWGRADRRVDERWFGDYSSYNLNSAVEWLGHRFRVAVNRSRRIDDELLADASVLILKTPSIPFEADELAAIERWVRAGGGLLAIGDHTDLHGMNTILNDVLAPHGLRLEFDAVSDGSTGGFNRWSRPRWHPDAASLAGVETLEFMTPCSLSVRGGTSDLMIAPRGARNRGDYANSSYFGSKYSDPQGPYGPVILGAAKEYGRGKVVVFTDSTIFSSFAMFRDGHDAYLLSVVSWLSRESQAWWPTLRLALACAAAALGIACLRSREAAWVAACVTPLWIGGTLWSDAYHRRVFAPPEPDAGFAECSVLWEGGMCGLPPTIGSQGSLPSDLAFDTLLQSIQRCGVWPNVAVEYEQCFGPHVRTVLIVNPAWTPPESFQDRLVEFARAGGSVVIVDRYASYPSGSSAPTILARFGFDLHVEERESSKHIEVGGLSQVDTASDLSLFAAGFGAGRVYFGLDSTAWSREGLGHCFSLPGRTERARLTDCFALIRDTARLDASQRNTYSILDR